MAFINPKLNLNKTPNKAENNSLVFAKNIRVDVDGSIHRDYGITPMSIRNTSGEVDWKSIFTLTSQSANANIPGEFLGKVRTACDVADGILTTSGENGGTPYEGTYEDISASIVGVIPGSNEFFCFINIEYNLRYGGAYSIYNKVSFIVRYDEKLDSYNICNCNWNYNGGKIDGYVVNNLRGEKILNIGESDTDVLVPFKSINLNKSSVYDDESIYTQTPNIPITNLYHNGYINHSIPNGVYQFFIRYKIDEDFYTDWIPASKELFIGNSNEVITSYGKVKYLNTHRSSDKSFSFNVEHLFIENINNYKSYQIGFICSTDDQIVARVWRTFDFSISTINFDYRANEAYEIEVTDLLKTSYQIYNVGNITGFKNKLYISNYTETNFNDSDLEEYANQVDITLKTKQLIETYNGYKTVNAEFKGKSYVRGFSIDGNEVVFSGTNGIFNSLLTKTNDYYNNSIQTGLIDFFDGNTVVKAGNIIYGLSGYINSSESLDVAKKNFRNSHANLKNIKFYDDIHRIYINNEVIYDFSKTNTNYTSQQITNLVIDYICNNIAKTLYLSYDGFFVDNNGVHANAIEIKIARSLEYTDYKNEVLNTTYNQTITIGITGNANYFSNNSDSIKNLTTLIPYQSYKFYIHYINSRGEITNGYFCKEITCDYMEDAESVIYPEFSNIKKPKNYVACFFSIVHSKNIVSTVFDITRYSKNNDSFTEGRCIDIDAGLNNVRNDLLIQQQNDFAPNANYHYSNDSSIVRYFGACGVLTWDDVTYTGNDIKAGKFAYLQNEYNLSEYDDISLVKCTPYIPFSKSTISYDNYINMNLLGYICEVYPIDKERSIKYYNDGGNAFYKTNNTIDKYEATTFELIELKNHLLDTDDSQQRITALQLYKGNKPVKIYSNWNLNFLSLIEEPTIQYKTYYNNSSDITSSDKEDDEKSDGSIILRLFPSLTMSNIYELSSMYKEYTRKTFSTYKTDETTTFDNTIRSSELYGDEDFINIFKFDAEDYYNVPTNRGKIVNLISVGDSILVHCEDSMFRFSGSNTLQSSQGEIQPTETNVFDTGVTEVFGSDFGFAGLQNKTDSITTETGYIFFDRDSRIIYMYSGQGQIIKISDSIEKLFKHRDIKHVYFANDYYNNRFFVCIIFYDKSGEYPVTLSFNLTDDIKSFVSLHDFYFYEAFNTKTKCYFITHERNDICWINKKDLSCYTKLALKNDKIYISKYIGGRRYIRDYNGSNLHYYDLNDFVSIIDVIVNDNYETIKTLDAVQWCSSILDEEFPIIDYNNLDTITMTEDLDKTLPCKYMRIYTDTCVTPLNEFTTRANGDTITSLDSYKQPRYNQGYWNFNYFRNIKFTSDHFRYLQNINSQNQTVLAPEGTPKYNDGRRTSPELPDFVSDNNSLIEGKYFVVRFGFDEEFKLEAITLLYKNRI